MAYVPLRKAVERLGLHPNTLRRYADEGKIQIIKNEAGQRLYNVEAYIRGAANGCHVIICSRDQDHLLKAAQEIEAKTGQLITAIPVDLCQPKSIEQLLENILHQFSTIDILVNNAAGMPYKRHYELKQGDCMNHSI